MGDFVGKVAFLTGAGAGIGRISSIMLAQQGARVVLAELRPESGKAVEAAIKDLGGDATFVQVDVTNRALRRGILDEDPAERFIRNELLEGSDGLAGRDKLLVLLAKARPVHLSRLGTFAPVKGKQPTPVSPGRGLCGSEL